MKKLIKVNNTDVIFKLNLNYESVHSNLRMLLGSDAPFFAEIAPMASYTTWYASKDMDYKQLKDASEPEVEKIMSCLNSELFKIRQQLGKSPQFAPYVDSLLMFPGIDFVFYLPLSGGKYEIVVAGWGCDRSHSNPVGGVFSGKAGVSKDKFEKDDKNSSGEEFTEFDKDILLDEPVEKSVPHKNELPQEDISEVFKDVNGIHAAEKHTYLQQKQNVLIRVLDQNSNPVSGENVIVKSAAENGLRISDERGIVEVGIMNVSDIFTVTFPNRNNVERSFVVEKDTLIYDVFIKKLVKSAPQLFVEDQNGLPVSDHKIKVIAAGKEMIFDTGETGVVQLPIMQEGQKFIVVDTANYANTTEFELTPKKAETPYHFIIPRKAKQMVDICVQDKDGNPMPGVTIEMADSNVPCFKTTDAGGRAEFPKELFNAAKIPLILKAEGMNPIKYKLKFNPSETEYGIVIKDKSFNWKWLGLIPVLAGLVWGGSEIVDKFLRRIPTVDEMKTGVVMVLEQTTYYVEFNTVDLNVQGEDPVAYFTYDSNTGTIDNYALNPDVKPFALSTGTGFLISEEGHIATNKHVADPKIPQKLAERYLRNKFQEMKNMAQIRAESILDSMNIAGIKNRRMFYDLKKSQEQVRIYDRLLNTADYEVQKTTNLYVAFTGTKIDPDLSDLEGFVGCNHLISGSDGDKTDENDVAIIQLRSKSDIPKNSYIFQIPEKDVVEDRMPQNRRITVIGYNHGFSYQNLTKQDGIQPQIQTGEINNLSEKFRIGYNAAIMPGSSGSPVVNDDGVLVAVNNSKIRGTDSFNFGIRVKYLREIHQQLMQNKQTKE